MDWKKVLGAVAPALATALGGPLAGMATAAVSDALLGKPDGSEAEMAIALKAGGSDALLRLKEADQRFTLEMEKLGLDLEKLHAGDRDSAREREAKTGDSWTPRVIAGVVVIGWFAIQAYLLQTVIQADMREIIMRTLGTLDMALGLVLGYYFGSSSSSRAKDELISGRRVQAGRVQ